jgi:hypothetical protein
LRLPAPRSSPLRPPGGWVPRRGFERVTDIAREAGASVIPYFKEVERLLK